MRRHTIFLILLTGLLLTGWGHEGPRVKVGLLLDDAQGKKAFLDRFRSELGSLNADLLLAQPGEGPEELLGRGVDALVVYGGEPGKGMVLKARQKGVPILSVEKPLAEEGQDFLIAYDPEKEAKILAGFALDKGVPGALVFLGRSNGDWFSRTYRDVLRKALQPGLDKGEIRFGKASHEQAPLAIWLVGDPKTLSATRGEVERMKWGANKKMVVGVGQDIETCRALVQGRQEMTVYRSPIKLAEETAYLAAKSARKAKTFDCQFIEVPHGSGTIKTVLLTPKLLDKSNLEGTLIKDGVFTKEELEGKVK